ncbi:hypothetical protein F383_31000 [Gossypium arboreum]|uniref:Uncharacterized protein n=1 Tax=Gossypium arboreum TaxID=29729 RepID=A0A0B0MXD4_GOSAR|nr:hypothetical protein F383_31000 [Gossypium arboreum]
MISILGIITEFFCKFSYNLHLFNCNEL